MHVARPFVVATCKRNDETFWDSHKRNVIQAIKLRKPFSRLGKHPRVRGPHKSVDWSMTELSFAIETAEG